MEDHKTSKMQAEETLWIQYPWDRHTKREDEMPIVGSPMDLRSSEIAEVHTFKIDDDHPIVARWEEVALEIITKLRQANLPWVAVNVLTVANSMMRAETGTTLQLLLPCRSSLREQNLWIVCSKRYTFFLVRRSCLHYHV